MAEFLKVEDGVFRDAIKRFWSARRQQSADVSASGTSNQGERGAVTGGKQLDGIADIIIELLESGGVCRSDIFSNCPLHKTGKLQLPGFFRPTKEWDILVVSQGHLVAAIELKSQVGPSFGNNFNNRTEEAMGSALDIWTAYREGAFQGSPAPWLGYLFVLEDAAKSRKPVRNLEPHFSVFPEFIGASYSKRYELFCRKLVRERHYNAACLILTDRDQVEATSNYSEPATDLSAQNFLSQLLHHVSK